MYGSPLLNAVGLLDGISAIERIKLTGQLTAQVGALGEAGNALARIQAGRMIGELIKRLTGDAQPAAQPEAFPLKEASSSYSGISHSGNTRAKGDSEDYEKTISGAVEEARPLAETDAQRAILASEEAAFRADYLRQYRQLMGVRSGTYSGYIAGRANLNSKQADSRNSALDKAMDRFYGWVKSQEGRIKAAVLAERNPEQRAAAQAEVDAAQATKDAKSEEAARKNVAFMAKLITFKSGDKLPVGGSIITKVSKSREGVPSSLTITMADGTKPFDDKIDVLRTFYRGDKSKLASDFAAARALLEPATEEARGGEEVSEETLIDAGLLKQWGERWKYKDSISSGALLYANSKDDAVERATAAYWKAKPEERLTSEQRFEKANRDEMESAQDMWGRLDMPALAEMFERMGGAISSLKGASGRELNGNGGRRTSAAVAAQGIRDTAEMRGKLGRYIEWRLEREPEENDTAEAPEDPGAKPLEIIEHVTGRGKTLRGVIRTDLTYAQAKEIDAYTFKKDGGYFIREQHLDGYTPGDAAPVVKPELTPEQQAQAEADRIADEQLRQQKKRAEQVSKLRESAQSTIDKAEEDLGRDRNTNTARRANMASSINARNEQARAIGKTMMNLAGAIESGEAKALASVTSKAAVETLHNALVSAMYEADKGLTYQQQLARKGRKAEPEDVRFAKFPSTSWDSASTSRAKVLEAIKGKRGAPALADKVRYAVGPDSETIRKLQDMVGKKEADSLLGWFNVEMAARAARLERAGITNADELKAALLEYLQFREGERAEDPIKKAERAIIGQKVGIDFFPTPAGESQRMVQMAGIKAGDRVLEPSAGNGNIADAAAAAGAQVDVLEISSQLREILKAKGYNIAGHDFMEFEPAEKYDAVLMNPPFSNRLDAAHIMRAYDMVKPGGKLVAIAGEGVFFGSDKKAVEFREWLEKHAAEVEQLPQGTFTDNKLLARTSANARVLVMEKR